MAKTDPPTAEVALRDGSKQLVTIDFAERFPALVPDEETLELLEANLGDGMETIGARNFKRVKVPAGESSSFMITQAGEEKAVKEIKGILVAWKARRSYWAGGGDPDGSAPDCSSVDNRHPVAGGSYSPSGLLADLNPTGLCANCPMAQFGSDENGGRGTACREQRLLFVTPENALFPLMVSAPRTSIQSVTEFMMDLMDTRKRYWEVEVGLSLVKDKNKDGLEYNKISVRVLRVLEPGESVAAKAYGDQIKAMVDAMLASFDRSDIDGGASTSGGGVSVGAPAS